MFFLVLFMYSYFVLISISLLFFDIIGVCVLEYFIYIWSVGDFIEELIVCFVSLCICIIEVWFFIVIFIVKR